MSFTMASIDYSLVRFACNKRINKVEILGESPVKDDSNFEPLRFTVAAPLFPFNLLDLKRCARLPECYPGARWTK